MGPHRWIIAAICMFIPAVSYRVGGAALWGVHGGGCLVAAGLALWLLHEDGALHGALQYKGGDATIALFSAAALYLPLDLLLQRWIAPDDAQHLLRYCGPNGAWIPRPDAHGLGSVAEWIRDRSCAAFSRSAGVRGPQRGALVLLVAAAEEVAWRAGMQRMLAERLGRVRGWLAAAALFGLAHLGTGNGAVALLAFGAGLVFGAIYLVRGAPESASGSADEEGEGEPQGAPSFSTMHLGLGRLVPCVFAHCLFSYVLFYQRIPFAIRYDTL